MASPFLKVSVNGTGPTGVVGTQEIFAGIEGVVTSCVFEVANLAASFSAIPRVRLIGQSSLGAIGTPPPTASINAQYINLASGAVSPAGTAIVANGIYSVYCPGCAVDLITSAGNADVQVQAVIGRIF
jgi:hypothetical protein